MDKNLNHFNHTLNSTDDTNILPLTVGIVGGGIAGSTIAIRLAALGVQTYLFEARSSLVDGPPMCHLHAGGNLYREIPDEDCIELLKQSIDILRMYPFSIDVRPTVIAIPTRDEGQPSDLLSRLQLLTNVYHKMIEDDSNNKVLGEPEDYFKLYERDDLERLIESNSHFFNSAHNNKPMSKDEWVATAARQLDLNKLKYPIVAVNEYGWNIFRLAASAHIALSEYSNATLLLNTKVTDVRSFVDNTADSINKWKITYFDSIKNEQKFLTVDYLINASGFKTGEIDNMLGINAKRMVEFKASYVAFWDSSTEANSNSTNDHSSKPIKLPEIIIHGKRGTPNGMVQLTPYPNGFYQIHSMNEYVTLFDDGLVTTKQDDAQPRLKPVYLDYINNGWDINTLNERSQRAINQVSEFVPKFASAKPTNNALHGGQQIPGENDTLRVADISLYPNKNYARAENVKASSALLAADHICEQLRKQNLLPFNDRLEEIRKQHNWHYLKHINYADIDAFANDLTIERKFPQEMANVVTSHSLAYQD